MRDTHRHDRISGAAGRTSAGRLINMLQVQPRLCRAIEETPIYDESAAPARVVRRRADRRARRLAALKPAPLANERKLRRYLRKQHVIKPGYPS